MRRLQKIISKILSPEEGCVIRNSHCVQLTNSNRGSSITYLFSPLILSSEIKDVLNMEFGAITKSMLRPTT
jgi:hypothetical protein